ncbi:MAG: hypothetical protein OEM46_03145 [Ignavibacteria bacterium]|nr:hypothetical protein [Ignavibacteria bacterium]
MLFKSTSEYLLSLLLISFLFIGSGFSQNASYLDSLDGKFALQFQISDNFQLSNFQGTTFSGKYHFGKMDAIRAGLSIDFGKSDGDAETNQYDSVNVAEASYNSNNFSMTLKTQYIRYFVETDGIAFYGGTGPFVTYSTSTNESETTGTSNDKHYKDMSDNFILGVDFIAGVEWFFIKNMSLSAEYGFNFSYRSRSSERRIDNGLYSDSNEKVYRFSGNDINFGITVYF